MKTLHTSRAALCCISAALAIAACAGSEEVTTSASSLVAAQCNFDQFHAEAEACFTVYEECIAAGVEAEGCRETLRACLPRPPERRPPPPPGDHVCDGGHTHDGPPPEGAPTPPPPPEGEEGQPPPPEGEYGPPPEGAPVPPGDAPPSGDGRLPPPDGERRPPPPGPSREVIEACHDTLFICLTDTPEALADCRAVERACIQGAFESAFQARCDEAEVRCAQPGAPADRCAEITARCAEGIQGPPEGPVCE